MSERKTKVWIPTILYLHEGGLHYETHGAFDLMVNTREKRRGVQGDFWGCFEPGPYGIAAGNHNTKFNAETIESARLHWLSVDVNYDPKKGSRYPGDVEKWVAYYNPSEKA